MIPEANTLLAHYPLVMKGRNVLRSMSYVYTVFSSVLDTGFCSPKFMKNVLKFLTYLMHVLSVAARTCSRVVGQRPILLGPRPQRRNKNSEIMLACARSRVSRAVSRRRFATVVDASGIRVAAVDHGQPSSTVTVVVKAGSRHESKPGVAHLLKNYAFKVRRPPLVRLCFAEISAVSPGLEHSRPFCAPPRTRSRVLWRRLICCSRSGTPRVDGCVLEGR